jgi:hypothetical protein
MNRKVGLIVLVVVIALGVLGVGYAAWTQTLTITGTVATAKFDVNFTGNTTPAAPTGGTVSSSIADPKAATLGVTNVYPGYSGDWTFTVTNSSSIPVSVVLTETSDTGNMFTAVPAGPVTIAANGGTQVYTVSILVPAWTGSTNQNASFSAVYTIVATQAP